MATGSVDGDALRVNAANGDVLREDAIATPLCASSKATVDFLEDLDMRRFAEVAKSCVLDAATCEGNAFVAETRDRWRRAVAALRRAPFVDRVSAAVASDKRAAPPKTPAAPPEKPAAPLVI